MIKDNQWHNGIIVRRDGDDGYAIFNSIEEAKKSGIEPAADENREVIWGEIVYNWNKGEPIFKVDGKTCRVVDNENGKGTILVDGQ